MKILQVSSHYVPAYAFGGPLQVAHALGQEWVRAGHQVTVCCTNRETPDSELGVPIDVPVQVDGIQVWYEPVTLLAHYGYSPKMYRRLKCLTPEADLVIVHSHYQYANWAGARIARRLKKPYVIFAHGSYRRQAIHNRHRILKTAYLTIAERRNFAGALRVVFGSEEELQDSIWSTRGMVLRNSVAPEQLRTGGEVVDDIFPAVRGKTIFLFLGRLNVKQKGLDLLMDSFSRATIDRKEAILVLAGPGERGGLQQLRDLVALNGLNQKVLFAGYVAGGLKASLLAAADVFVLPSRSEGASMALAEALYMGLPVIVTPAAGMTREILENRMGIVATPGEGLTSAIKTMLDPRARASYAGRGRSFVLENLLWNRSATRFLKEIGGWDYPAEGSSPSL